MVLGDRVGRGNSIYDNVSGGGEIWVINDEDPEKINQGFETCVVLKKSSKGKWFVIEVDEGFKSSDKMLQSLVDAYNQEKNWLELEALAKQNEYEEAFDA